MDIGHLHFLVAHGDGARRRELAGMLGGLGACRVSEVADGRHALHALAPERVRGEPVYAPIPAVDIAVIDLGLPGIDGLALIRQLGERGCAARLVVTGDQPSGLLFSVETLAQAIGVELLGTIAMPAGSQHAAPEGPGMPQALAALLGNYTPLASPSRGVAVPRLGFERIATGLDAGEFEPFFQPKIALADGEVKALEAFARWRHPEHGVLGPASFIEALAQHGRVDFLDWSMIGQSVARCRWLRERGTPIAVSLNIAPETLAERDFVGRIQACLAQHRVDPPDITFEMPESSVLNADPDFIERLVRLRMMGFGLAIDDYGTGRSNLQLLARIPFTELKIDRSFVDGASRRRPLGTVLRSFLGLARNLDRMSVAVGVETCQDWDFLQSLGCTYAQGYHIANPMPATAFPAWLDDWRQFF